jgi:hypothetical protein
MTTAVMVLAGNETVTCLPEWMRTAAVSDHQVRLLSRGASEVLEPIRPLAKDLSSLARGYADEAPSMAISAPVM